MAKTRKDKLRAELTRLNDRLTKLERDRDDVAERLRRCEQNEVRFTSHGLLRYLTRVKGYRIDEEALLAEIVTDDLQDLVDKLGGTGKFPCDGYTLIMKEHDIVTVLTQNED